MVETALVHILLWIWKALRMKIDTHIVHKGPDLLEGGRVREREHLSIWPCQREAQPVQVLKSIIVCPPLLLVPLTAKVICALHYNILDNNTPWYSRR